MKPVIITNNMPTRPGHVPCEAGEYAICNRCGKSFMYRYGTSRSEAHRCMADVPWTKPWGPR